MANSLILHNQHREERVLQPMAENGNGDVRIIQYASLGDEIEGVASMIVQLIHGGTPAGSILVLAQRGVIGTPIYERLIELGVPVRSYYAESELDSDDAQRKFALLRLFSDRDDRVSLRWLLGVEQSNWLRNAYQRPRTYCETNGCRFGNARLHASRFISEMGDAAPDPVYGTSI